MRAHPGSRAAARRPERRPAGGRPRHDRPGRHPGRRRVRQDPGHQPPDRLRHRDRRRPGGPGPRRHLHGQGRRRDGRAARRPGPARRHRPHVPRPRPEPAAPLLAARPRRRAAARTCSTRRCRCSSRSPAACPGHYRFTPGQGPRRRDRMGQEPAPDADDLRGRGGRQSQAKADARTADPARPVHRRLRRLRASQDAGRPDRLRRPARRARSTSSRRTRTPPRRSAPASAGSASTSTRTPTRSSSGCSSCGWATGATCASSATRTRRSTRSPGATSRFLTGFAERYPGARVVELAENYRSIAARSWPSPTTCSPPPAGRSAWSPRSRPARSRPSPGTGRRPAELAALARWIRERIAEGIGAGRDRRPRPDQRPARPDRGRADPGRHRLPGARRPLLRPAGCPRRDRPGPAGRVHLDRDWRWSATIRALWAAKLGYDDDVVAGPCRRGGPRADRRPRHAARHPRHPGPLGRAGGRRRRTSPSWTGGARRSARARPTA